MKTCHAVFRSVDLFLTVALLSWAAPAHANPVTFTSSASDYWNATSPAPWTPSPVGHEYPIAGDTAILNGNWTITLSAPAECNTLNVHHGTVSGQVLNLNGYPLTVDAQINWYGGYFGGGPFDVNVPMMLSGPDQKTWCSGSGTYVNNHNTITHDGIGSLSLWATSNWYNAPGGQYILQGDNCMVPDGSSGGGTPTFHNMAGAIFIKSGGAGTATLSGVCFDNEGGTIRLLSGSLHLATGGAISTGGTFQINPGCTLDLSVPGGMHNFRGAYDGSGGGHITLTAGTLELSPSATFNFAGDMFQWSGGKLADQLVNNNTINLTGSGTMITSTSLTNHGAINHYDDGNLGIWNASHVYNEYGATYDIKNDGGMTCPNGGAPQFHNKAGALLVKSGGTGVSLIDGVGLCNEGGEIEVDSGTLHFTGGNGISTGGEFEVLGGAMLDLSVTSPTSSHHLTGTYTGYGTGRVEFDQGTINVDTPGATFNFPAGCFQWAGGLFLGSPLTNNGTINLYGLNAKQITNLQNNGTVVQIDNGPLQFASGGNVTNNNTAIYDIHGDAGFSGAINAGFYNMYGATFRKSGGMGTSLLAVPVYSRGGTIDVQSGTLQLGCSDGADSTGGAFNVAAGATLDLSPVSGAHNFGGPFAGTGSGHVTLTSGQIYNSQAGGTTFNFPGNMFQWTGGKIYGNTLINANVINAAGSGAKQLNNLVNNGTMNQMGTGDVVLVGNETHNGSGALWRLLSDAGIGDDGGGRTLTNDVGGLICKLAGVGMSIIAPTLNNVGTVHVSSGKLNLTAIPIQLSNSTLTGGTWRTDTGCELLMAGANITTNQGTVILDGPNSAFAKINSLATNESDFEILDGRNFSTAGTLTNSGTLIVGTGSTLTVNDTLSNTGTVQGAGTIVGDLTNSGTFSPGLSPGTLSVIGDYTQDSAGKLQLEINGTTAGTYDVLAVSGVATLAGTLKVTLGNGVTLPGNATFDILTGASVSGTFATLDLPQFSGDGNMFTVEYKSNRVTLRSKCRLTVQSSPITGISIPGTYPGITNYTLYPVGNASVTLTAPLTFYSGGRYYAFYRWTKNGSGQTVGQRKLVFKITSNTTAVATYKRYKSMAITGPTSVYESSTAKYACRITWSDGKTTTVTLYATWTDNSSYAKFTAAGTLKTSSVRSNQRCRITAAYGTKSCYLNITIRNR